MDTPALPFTAVKLLIWELSLEVVSTKPSVSSPISVNASADVPRSLRAIVRKPAPTCDGSWITEFALVTKAIDLFMSFPEATKAEADV